MLQQTTVVAVIPYYERFLARFPTIQALARAREHDVLRLWEGLGYYNRARNLHSAARKVVDELGGTIPQELDDLLGLPGIGRYTAGAIASLAYDRPAPQAGVELVHVRRYLAFGLFEPHRAGGRARSPTLSPEQRHAGGASGATTPRPRLQLRRRRARMRTPRPDHRTRGSPLAGAPCPIAAMPTASDVRRSQRCCRPPTSLKAVCSYPVADAWDRLDHVRHPRAFARSRPTVTCTVFVNGSAFLVPGLFKEALGAERPGPGPA